jgi:hypothetical protein
VALTAIPLGVAASLSCSGPGANLGCPSADNACGGNPAGVWALQGACQFVPPLSYSVAVPDSPQQVMPQSPTLAGAAPPTKSAGDWCQDLIYSAGQVVNVNLYHAPPAAAGIGGVHPVQWTLASNNTYNAGLQLASENAGHFAPSCLTAFGDNPSCSDLTNQLTSFYGPMPNFSNIVCCTPGSTPQQVAGSDAGPTCDADSSNGCDCTYIYNSTKADEGTWQVVGNILYFFSALDEIQPITTTNFCVKDGTLTITGLNGQSILGVSGWRSATLSLVPNSM